eukprot:2972621-Pleurochrysis_carterae.AAC.2
MQSAPVIKRAMPAALTNCQPIQPKGHARKTRLCVLRDMFGETCLATEKRAGVAWVCNLRLS